MTKITPDELDRLEAIAKGDYRPPQKDPFNIETDRLYGGLSGASLPSPVFDLGFGLTMRQTYSKLMLPYILAFAKPAKPTAPSPGLGLRWAKSR